MTDMDTGDDADSRGRDARRHSTGSSTTTRRTQGSVEPPTHGPTQAVRPDGRLHEHLGPEDWRNEPTSGVVHHETCVCNPCSNYAKHVMTHMWSGDQSLVRAMAARDAAIVKQADLGKKASALKRDLDDATRDLEDARRDNDDLADSNDRLRTDAGDLRDENDRLRASADDASEENTRLLSEIADLHDKVDSLRGKLRDAEDDMHRERRRKLSSPPPGAPVAPSIPLADRMPKLPLADRMRPTTGRTLLTPGEDGSMRHTYLPSHVLQSDQARQNMAFGLPPPLGTTPVGGRDGYLADTDPATIAAVDSLFAAARRAPNGAVATKARHFMHRVSLTPADRHTPAIKHAIATWNTTHTEHAPQETATGTHTNPPPSKKRGTDGKARPTARESPHTWREWLITHPDPSHLRQHTRGVGTSDEFPMRNVRGYVAVMRLAPPRGKARSAYMLRAASLLGVPQAYREALETSGEEVAEERHDTPMDIDYDPTSEEVATHFARNGLTLAEADDYWAWGQEFISTYISDIKPSARHLARIAYESMNSTPHLPPTLEGLPDDHEASFREALMPLSSPGHAGQPVLPEPEGADYLADAPSPRF
ncbi:hypothetical protein FA95DRAFT_1573709 [Auriscalpium vulgare]|uniref:Uncharacterized protein n=1 Tax=Auriscalpium vulgare TaxID=40419 RepID=A0ACB8RQ20_9AGAM|nr:hypothetical protein FA95DRAFT_1573709 [Auriscalpium vulgare]